MICIGEAVGISWTYAKIYTALVLVLECLAFFVLTDILVFLNTVASHYNYLQRTHSRVTGFSRQLLRFMMQIVEALTTSQQGYQTPHVHPKYLTVRLTEDV